jgi:hypothetical protein
MVAYNEEKYSRKITFWYTHALSSQAECEQVTCTRTTLSMRHNKNTIFTQMENYSKCKTTKFPLRNMYADKQLILYINFFTTSM